jgi:putative ABC transport system permease protein
MKMGFYPRLALDGIRKNKRLYLPYILTCIGMVAMYYIVTFLQYSDALSYLPGTDALRATLALGSWVIAIFAAIFLFYTNSFLIRRRKKEFGLYHILGMGKRNIGRILFWEALMVSLFSLGAGLVCGIACSKLAELGLVNTLKETVRYSFSISSSAVLITAAVFGGIFVLLFLNGLRQVKFSNAMALLRSENVGEKPPKGNWVLGILGVLLLGAAYYIAVTISDPISALALFFVAVILVILGTYLLFIAGSVLLCRILQKKKSYYYKPNHFISVSSMAYRMKRNGAGLASICILATMVLVMISTTTCLYFGSEDALKTRYPKEINVGVQMTDLKGMEEASIEALRGNLLTLCREKGTAPSRISDYRRASVTGVLEGTTVETDVTKVSQFQLDTYSDVLEIQIIPLEDYNRVTNQKESLKENEVLLYLYRMEYGENTLTIRGGNTFHIKKQLDTFLSNGEAAMNIIPTMTLIVPDLETGLKGISDLKDYNGNPMVSLKWIYEFDTDLEGEQQIALNDAIRERIREASKREESGIYYFLCESRAENQADYNNTFGGLFFLSILLSLVFLFAAVLMIYYKQISEGYEDQSRFEMMQKVGMTKKDIRKSINSQLLTVFFLPLLGAGCHLAFAFPMIRKILLLFNLNNVALFALTTGISFLIFALLYTLVYRITSNAYYHLVSGISEAER